MATLTHATSAHTSQISITGVSCASCVRKIETTLCALPGVTSAEMNFADRTLSVTASVDFLTIKTAIVNLGYGACEIEQTSHHDNLTKKDQADALYYQQLLKHTYFALIIGGPLMLYGMLGGAMSVVTFEQRLGWLSVGLLSLAVMVVSGKHFYIGAFKSCINHSANMDTLIALGTGTAWLFSMLVVIVPEAVPLMARHLYFEATVMILGLVNLGLALEVKARGKTSSAIKKLVGLQPKMATVIRKKNDNNSYEEKIKIEQVQLGDVIKIRPGEKMPVDGVITKGHSSIDESMLSGESMPIEKTIGDTLVAGSINKSGTLHFRATKIGKDTALAHIIDLVKRAQNSKPPIGRLADIISAYFAPSVMIISILSAVLWLNFGPDPAIGFAVVSATTVLIIACPCALGLATPMSVMVGVGKAAQAGVLIRNGEALQSASTISVMLLDKTGTITEGSPTVTDLILTSSEAHSSHTHDSVLTLAASLENGSEHPLAQAIVKSAADHKLTLSEVENFNAIAGKGVEASYQNHSLLLGNEKLMADKSIDLTGFIDKANALAKEAKTPMYFAIDQMLVAIIAVADPIKSDSILAIRRLQQTGIRVIMLTGDNTDTAAAIAKKVGITEFFAEVLPADKTKHVATLQQQHEIVAMTGDGINDAPALALANVGFAIGTGTDVAIASADIILMRGSLHGLADAIAISKATLGNIKQNLAGAFIYNMAGIPIAAGILYPVFGILLNPVIAGAAMALSSLTVVLNANRLRFFNSQNYSQQKQSANK